MADLLHLGRRNPLRAGATLFDLADELAQVVPDTCRRTGRCRECVVEVRAGADELSPPTEAEAYLRPPYRLACQARVETTTADIEVAVLRRRLQIVSAPEGVAALPHPAPLEPAVHRDGDRVRSSDRVRHAADLGPYLGALIGLAIDVGTTTVVMELVDLEADTSLRRIAIENPQRFGGSDVISRIEYDGNQAPGELRRALRRALDHELRLASSELGIDRRAIVDVVLVGNPTMRDLAFGFDVRSIGARPFRSVAESAMRAGLRRGTSVDRPAHELGLLVHPNARVWGGPLIGSHVGADVAADLVAVGMTGGTDGGVARVGDPAGGAAGGVSVEMLVDIGTNSEVVVRNGDRWFAASCPAGPAFEGGGISRGMQAVEGAIQSVRLGPDGPEVSTIGDVTPIGLCGSGLIDLLAELRRTGRLTPEGAFIPPAQEFAVVADGSVGLTRRDVSLLAQAKAASVCGEGILLDRLGVAAAQVDRLWLAGGFATYVDVDNAIDIGLLPPIPRDRIVKVGNASLAGAVRLLRSVPERRRLEALVRRIEHVELELDPSFFDRFVDGCRWTPQLPEVQA